MWGTGEMHDFEVQATDPQCPQLPFAPKIAKVEGAETMPSGTFPWYNRTKETAAPWKMERRKILGGLTEMKIDLAAVGAAIAAIGIIASFIYVNSSVLAAV